MFGTVRTTPRHGVLMVIGDLDARVGEDNTGKERAMGTQGFGCANNNGERLSDLCGEQTGHWWYPIYAQRYP